MSTKKLQIVNQLVTIDETLTQSGVAADAKAVGDAINAINTSLDSSIQPDWNQTDETQKDYIKNKPEDLAHTSDIPVVDATLSIDDAAADAKATGDAIQAISALVGDEPVATQITQAIEANKVDITGLATETYVDTKVAGIVNSAPETLDTLNELATALGNDPNFATTVATQIGTKVPMTRTVNGKALSGDITLTASDLGIEAITEDEIDSICSSTLEFDDALIDDTTGTAYKLYVSNGDLKMTEVG